MLRRVLLGRFSSNLRLMSGCGCSGVDSGIMTVKYSMEQCIKRGEYAQALPYSLKLVEYCRDTFGEGHASYASSLNNLAFIYKRSGDISSSITMYEVCVEKYIDSHGKFHTSTAVALNNLGIAYKEAAKYKDAESCFETALEIREKCLGKNHVEYAKSLSALASLSRETKEFEKAHRLFQKALQLFDKHKDECPLDFATCLHNLGYLNKENGDFKEAERLYLEALKTRIAHLPSQPEGYHPDIEASLNSLLSLYDTIGDTDKREKLLSDYK